MFRQIYFLKSYDIVLWNQFFNVRSYMRTNKVIKILNKFVFKNR